VTPGLALSRGQESNVSFRKTFSDIRLDPLEGDVFMRTIVKLAPLFALVVATASQPIAARSTMPVRVGPTLSSIGPLSFGPDGVLFAADRQAATIYALNLGTQSMGKATGTADVPAITVKIASMLGTAPTEITIADLAVHPKSGNSFLAVMRGQGASAQPALLRVDGAGTLGLVSLETVTYTSVAVPNPAAVSTTGRGGRAQSVTDMALSSGRLFVSGLSNEEFASKLWSVPYPFSTADRGTSVEIYHGNHGQLETRSPVMTFLPLQVGGQPHLIASYTCTPLVRFPVSALKPGEKIVGTTIAEFGAGNQPLDMIAYEKDGKSFLLMSNSNRGVMKIPTSDFGSAAAITARVGGTAGIPFETIMSMTGVEQLDRLDAGRSVVISRAATGERNLTAVPLP
jgi:hypothetical protein